MSRYVEKKTIEDARFLAWLVSVLAVVVFLCAFISMSSFQTVEYNDGILTYSDFSYYIMMVKSFWLGDIKNIYEYKSQITVMENWVGQGLSRAMPMGLTPTVLLVFLPFVPLAKFNLSICNALWVSLSLTVFYYCNVKGMILLFGISKKSIAYYTLLLAVLVSSLRFKSAVFLGQTSVIACGLLLALIMEVHAASVEGRAIRKYLVYPAFLILSIKLHYVLLALCILCLFDRFREVIVSSVSYFIVIGLMCAFWGRDIVYEWVYQLQNFLTAEVTSHYGNAISKNTYVTLYSTCSSFLGEAIAMNISKLVILTGLLIVAASVLLNKSLRTRAFNSQNTLPAQRLVLMIYGIIISCMPYLGGYEDILIACPLFLAALHLDQTSSACLKAAFILCSLMILLNMNLWHTIGPMWVVWVLKLSVFLMAYLMTLTRKPSYVAAGSYS